MTTYGLVGQYWAFFPAFSDMLLHVMCGEKAEVIRKEEQDDPLGQPHIHTRSEYYFHWKINFVLLDFESGHVSMDGQTACINVMITKYRLSGSRNFHRASACFSEL